MEPKNEIINIATVTLVFINKDTGKPCLAPKIILDKF